MLLNIAFEVMLAEVMIINTPAAVFLWSLYIYNNVCWSKGYVQDLPHRHLKDVKNNHNTFLAMTFLFFSISFQVALS